MVTPSVPLCPHGFSPSISRSGNIRCSSKRWVTVRHVHEHLYNGAPIICACTVQSVQVCTFVHKSSYRTHFIHVHVLVYIMIEKHLLTCIYTHTLSYTHTHTHSLTHTHTHTLSHTHTHTRTHSLTHTHTHTLSHTLTHTHTHAHSWSHSVKVTTLLSPSSLVIELFLLLSHSR